MGTVALATTADLSLASRTTGITRPDRREHIMGKAAISLTTGLEDPEKVTVAFLVAVGAAVLAGGGVAWMNWLLTVGSSL